MQVNETMTREVCLANVDETIEQAARMMAGLDVGVLPVGENNSLVGMITDRDIAIRAVGEGLGPETKVREVISRDVKYCFADQDIEDVSSNMAEIRVRRLPVLDRDKNLVGILSLGDVAVTPGSGAAAEALTGISRPRGPHSQTG